VTHLILHKVRGEAAFDVAEKIMIGDEEGWIIPTSGHRAYPFKTWELDDLVDSSDIGYEGYHICPVSMQEKVPEDWPDHYAAVKVYEKPKAQPAVALSLEDLGL